MKKLLFITFSFSASTLLLAQSHTVKGKLVPSYKNSITILPTTEKFDNQSSNLNFVELKSTIRVYKTSLQPQLVTIYPVTTILPVNTIPQKNTSTSSATVAAVIPVKVNETKKEVLNPEFRSLTDNVSTPMSENKETAETGIFRSLTDVTSSTNIINQPLNSIPSLEPLVDYPSNFKSVETIDPTLMNQNKQLAPLTQNQSKSTGRLIPELAPIYSSGEKSDTKKTSGSQLPELAPIESGYVKPNSGSDIPELAPLEQNKTNYDGKSNSNQKGMVMPTGTKLSSQNGSFIFKPITQVQISEESSDNIYGPYRNRTSAGGGMGMPALAAIETYVKKDESTMPALAKIEKLETPKTDIIPALAPIEPGYTKTEYTAPALAAIENFKYQPIKKTTVPCQHIHDPNCPCSHAPVKKPVAKKKTIAKSGSSKPKVIYVYKQAPQQYNNERVVYVQNSQNVQTEQPQEQPKQQMVLYRDYTNVYNKQNQNQSQQPSTKSSNLQDAQKYYNPSNYAQGLSAGPTSGDYPMTNTSADVNMKYTFHVNEKGKYGVSIYNDFCYILLSQNGKVIEYRSSSDPSYGKPRLNFFGAPTNVSGIPIEYNYNRSVSKIGSIRFEYDFEGFFKKVSSSNVFYTSRSSLSNVDNIYVRYDGGGRVSSVDPNNGIVSFNGEN